MHSEVWSSDGSYTVDRDSEDGGRELDRDAAGSQHSQGYSEEFNSQVFKQGSCKKKKRQTEREKSSILGTGDIVKRLTPRYLSASCSKRTRSIVREHVL